MGPFDQLADRQRVRVLLRLHRRRDQPVLPGHLRGHDPVEPPKTPEEGYHFTEDMTDKAIALGPRSRSRSCPTSRSSCTTRRARPTRRTTCPQEWSDKYKGRFDAGWDALREETFARQKELGVIPADAELTAAARGDPGVGRHAERPQAGARPPDGGLRRLPGAHRPPRRPAARRARGARGRSTTRSIYYIIGDNGASAEGTINGTFNEMLMLNGAAALRDARVHGVARSTSSARPRRTTTTRSAGPTPWTPRTSGPSRSRRTGAAPATAPSSTGRTASRRKGEVRAPVPPRHRHRTDRARGRRAPRSPTFVNGIQQMPLTA